MWKLTFSRVTAALSRFLPWAGAAIAVLIFAFDMMGPPTVAVGALYLAAVLVAGLFCGMQGVVLTGLWCACLMLIAACFGVEDPINAAIRISAVGFGTFLVVKARSAEEATRRSEAEWREVFEHSPVMYFMVDAAGAVQSVNAFGSTQLGYRADELIGRSVFQVLLDADRERARANLDLCLESLGQSNTWEVQKLRKDGATLWVRETATAMKRAKGGVIVLIAGEDITERRRAEESVRESAKRFRALIEHAYDAVLLLDSNNSVLYASPSIEPILGYSPEEVVGRDRFDLFHPDQLRDAKEQFAAASRDPGSVYRAERLLRHKYGKWLWIENTVTNLLGEPSVHAFVMNLRDITQSKRAEDALRASEERFRSFINHATDGFFLFDEHQAVLDVNRQACDGLGYSREEMIGMHPRDFDAGLDAASIARIAERVDSGETVTFETLHRRKDGTMFSVEVRARQFQQGAHRFRLSLARDITERKRAEEVLRQSEVRLERAQRIAHVGWWERDFVTNRVHLSDEASRIFGIEPVDLPDWHDRWLKLIHPEDRPRAAEAAAAALRGDSRYDVEYRVVRPDGVLRIVHSQGDVTWDDSGEPLRQFGVMQDITELRQAEQELRASESRFRTFADYAKDAFFLQDDQLTILDVNQQACVGLGYSREELIGMHPRIFDVGLDEASIELLRQRVLAGETLTFETRHQRKDGTVFPVEILAAQFEQFGRRRNLILVRDITERKQAEEQSERLRQLESDLAHLNRLSMMGELTASLAHEILHPIATARNNARAATRFLDMSPPDLCEVREALSCIVRDADRAKDIVGRVRDHVKKAPPRSDQFEVNEAIEEVIVMVRSAIEKNKVSVRTDFIANSISVEGDRVQLQQVVLNLILNAIEAMNSVEEGARELSIRTEQNQTSGVLIAVRDSGPGIDQEHFARVFDPFYTTKTGGLGMGLAICRSIIDAHGGRLWVGANEPRGAVFQFTLPAAQLDS